MDTGYLYIVNGRRAYLEEAVRSLASLRRHDSDAHATLITDAPFAEANEDLTTSFDQVILQGGRDARTWREGLLYKSNVIRHSPYQRTFFVDSDTYFLGSCRHLFQLLDAFDLLVVPAPAESEIARVNGELRQGFTPYNTGVLVFRDSDGVRKLLRRWSEIYEREFDRFPHDQPPFMEALATVPIATYVAPNVYNFRFPFFERAHGTVLVLHGRHPNPERIGRAVNSASGNRVWLPPLSMCIGFDTGVTSWVTALVRIARLLVARVLRRVGPYRIGLKPHSPREGEGPAGDPTEGSAPSLDVSVMRSTPIVVPTRSKAG